MTARREAVRSIIALATLELNGDTDAADYLARELVAEFDPAQLVQVAGQLLATTNVAAARFAQVGRPGMTEAEADTLSVEQLHPYASKLLQALGLGAARPDG